MTVTPNHTQALVNMTPLGAGNCSSRWVILLNSEGISYAQITEKHTVVENNFLYSNLYHTYSRKGNTMWVQMLLLQILYLFKYDNLLQSKHVRQNHFIICPDFILHHKHNFFFHLFILPVSVPQNDFLYSNSVHNTASMYKLKEQTMVRAF